MRLLLAEDDRMIGTSLKRGAEHAARKRAHPKAYNADQCAS